MGVRGNNESGRLVFLFALLVLFVAAGTFCNGVTITTFLDTLDGPMFSVNVNNDGTGTISSIWGNFQTGLTLEVYTGQTYENAFFVMEDPVTFDADGVTGGGTIEFFDDWDTWNTSGDPLIKIEFTNGSTTSSGFGAMSLFGDNVAISGSEIVDTLLPGESLVNETFSFAFGNPSGTSDSYTVTSAFTSSADIVPEPATICLLSLGLVMIRKRKK